MSARELFRGSLKGLKSVSGTLACLFIYWQADGSLLARQLILGYKPIAPELQSLGGGGLVSMIQPALIVVSSSMYAGLFEATGLLDGLKAVLVRMAAKLGTRKRFGCKRTFHLRAVLQPNSEQHFDSAAVSGAIWGRQPSACFGY